MSSSNNKSVKRTKVQEPKIWGREPTAEEEEAVLLFAAHLGVENHSDEDFLREFKEKHAEKIKTARSLVPPKQLVLKTDIVVAAGRRLEAQYKNGMMSSCNPVRAASKIYSERILHVYKEFEDMEKRHLILPVEPDILSESTHKMMGRYRSAVKENNLCGTSFDISFKGIFKQLLPRLMKCFGGQTIREMNKIIHGFGMFCDRENYHKALRVQEYVWRTPAFSLPMITCGSLGEIDPSDINKLFITGSAPARLFDSRHNREALRVSKYLNAGIISDRSKNGLPGTSRAWENMVHFCSATCGLGKLLKNKFVLGINIVGVKDYVLKFAVPSMHLRNLDYTGLEVPGQYAVLNEVLRTVPALHDKIYNGVGYGAWCYPESVAPRSHRSQWGADETVLLVNLNVGREGNAMVTHVRPWHSHHGNFA